MSRRLSGLEPEYGLLNTSRQSRRRDISESTSTDQPLQQNIFLRPQKKTRVQSEPIQETQKLPFAAPIEVAVKETEQVIPLSKDEMLRILSREMPLERAAINEKFMRNSNIRNQEVPSIYSSYFFRKDIVKEFQKKLINLIPSEKLASFPLSTYNLYNKDDILNNTIYRPDVLGSRNIEKTIGYTNESKENSKIFLNFLSKNVCSEIGGSYAKNAVTRAIDLSKNESGFDILVASTRILEDVTLPIERRLDGIVAFVIVELGECKKYPASYSINLICTDTKKAIPGTGSILMGAFLYTILSHPNNTNPSFPIVFPDGKSNLKVTSKRIPDGTIIENCTFSSSENLVPIQQIAILELANSYKNTGGLCMYEKFGFTYDQTMFTDSNKGIDCFDDRSNLPMLIDFNTKPGYAELDKNAQKSKILNITSGNDKGFQKSKICSLRGDEQKLLGFLKSLKLYLDNTPGETMDDFLSTSDDGIMINQLRRIHQDPNAPRGRRAPISSAREGTLEEFINYLENPPQPDDPVMKEKVNRLIPYLPKSKKKGGMTRKKQKISKRFTKKRY